MTTGLFINLIAQHDGLAEELKDMTTPHTAETCDICGFRLGHATACPYSNGYTLKMEGTSTAPTPAPHTAEALLLAFPEQNLNNILENGVQLLNEWGYEACDLIKAQAQEIERLRAELDAAIDKAMEATK